MRIMKYKRNTKQMKNFQKTLPSCEWGTQCGNDKMKTKPRKNYCLIIFCNRIIKALEMITELCKIRILIKIHLTLSFKEKF